MAQTDFGTGKSLVVLAIVLGCFAILWPKIFYPMMQTAFAMTSPNVDADGRFTDPDRPPHLHPASVNPRGRGPSPEDVHDKFMMREGRPFPHPQSRQPTKSQPKSGGAMSIIMPIYTVGIVVFFLYTVLKLVFKKDKEGEKKPLIKDFHMDPEYRKFVCSSDSAKKPKVEKLPQNKKTNLAQTTIPEEDPGMDQKDFEIYKLRKKLEQTEQAMEHIIKHMGVVNVCLSEKAKLQEELTNIQSSDVRQRHKGEGTKVDDRASVTSKEYLVEEEGIQEVEGEEDPSSLEKDLAELINLCNITGHSLTAEVEPSGSEAEEEGTCYKGPCEDVPCT